MDSKRVNINPSNYQNKGDEYRYQNRLPQPYTDASLRPYQYNNKDANYPVQSTYLNPTYTYNINEQRRASINNNISLPPLREVLADVLPNASFNNITSNLNNNRGTKSNNANFITPLQATLPYKRVVYDLSDSDVIPRRKYERNLYYNKNIKTNTNQQNNKPNIMVGKPKRNRRKYEEIKRIFSCTFEGCNKSYGTLNHLNSHIVLQNHGQKKTLAELKYLENLDKMNCLNHSTPN